MWGLGRKEEWRIGKRWDKKQRRGRRGEVLEVFKDIFAGFRMLFSSSCFFTTFMVVFHFLLVCLISFKMSIAILFFILLCVSCLFSSGRLKITLSWFREFICALVFVCVSMFVFCLGPIEPLHTPHTLSLFFWDSMCTYARPINIVLLVTEAIFIVLYFLSVLIPSSELFPSHIIFFIFKMGLSNFHLGLSNIFPFTLCYTHIPCLTLGPTKYIHNSSFKAFFWWLYYFCHFFMCFYCLIFLLFLGHILFHFLQFEFSAWMLSTINFMFFRLLLFLSSARCFGKLKSYLQMSSSFLKFYYQ